MSENTKYRSFPSHHHTYWANFGVFYIYLSGHCIFPYDNRYIVQPTNEINFLQRKYATGRYGNILMYCWIDWGLGVGPENYYINIK